MRGRSQAIAANRRAARIAAMQALFAADLTDGDPSAALEELVEDQPVESTAAAFARRLVTGVAKHQRHLDQIIHEAAPQWSLDQMPTVDKAILRLALFEIIVDNRAPLRAVINEAVELAKAFGGEQSRPFINGVLGTVASGLATNDAPQRNA